MVDKNFFWKNNAKKGLKWVPGQLVQRHLVQRHLVQDAWYKDKRSKQTLGPKDTWYKGQKVQRQMVQSDTWYNRQKVQCFVKPDKRSKRQKVQSDKIFKIFFFFTKKDFRSDKKFKIFFFFTKNDFLCSWTIKLYLHAKRFLQNVSVAIFFCKVTKCLGCKK